MHIVHNLELVLLCGDRRWFSLRHPFFLQVEPRKYSIYREEAVDAITEALDGSLADEIVRENCCRALFILGGRFSFSGELLTESWILKQAGFYDYDKVTLSLHDEEDSLLVDDASSMVKLITMFLSV